MSSSRAETVDVRIAIYSTQKGHVGNVTWFNELHKLLECKRVILVFDENRLYFHKGDSVAGSIVIGQRATTGTLQIHRDVERLKKFEGEYLSMRFDSESDTYYVDLSDRITTTYGPANTKSKPNRKSPEKRGDTAPMHIKTVRTYDVPESGLKSALVQTPKKSDAQIQAEKVVVSALMALLESQISDNADAIATLTTLKNYI